MVDDISEQEWAETRDRMNRMNHSERRRTLQGLSSVDLDLSARQGTSAAAQQQVEASKTLTFEQSTCKLKVFFWFKFS